MTSSTTANGRIDTSGLKKKAIIRLSSGIIVYAVIFFLPAGGFGFWQAWLFLAILFIPMSFALVYLLRTDPGLLQRRLKTREKVARQKFLIFLIFIIFLVAYIIPGFDYRFEWSRVPIWLVIISDMIIFAGYLLFLYILRENSYAFRTIEVEEGQKVIDTGPYAFVRHPMYTASLLMFLFSPTALGSYWAVIPMILVVPLIILRIFNEEKVLKRDLPGYMDYLRRVKYRLIPGVW